MQRPQQKSKPHISSREYIRWPPADSYENTDTLVVTSAGGRYVDIRTRIYNPEVQALLPPGINHSEGLEWAFAGVSSNEIIHDRKDHKPKFLGSWRHLVDSRTADGDSVQDMGEMIPLDATRTLEKGRMVNPLNPDAGEQAYEEGWKEVAIESTREDGVIDVAVLQLMEDEVGARGMVVRVGQVCQGMVRVREEYSCERWLWTKEGGWKRTWKDGGIWMPTALAMEGGVLEVGDDVKFEDFPWKVVEVNAS